MIVFIEIVLEMFFMKQLKNYEIRKNKKIKTLAAKQWKPKQIDNTATISKNCTPNHHKKMSTIND